MKVEMFGNYGKWGYLILDRILCAAGGAAAAAALLSGIIYFVIYKFRASALMQKLNSEYGERRNGKHAQTPRP